MMFEISLRVNNRRQISYGFIVYSIVYPLSIVLLFNYIT